MSLFNYVNIKIVVILSYFLHRIVSLLYICQKVLAVYMCMCVCFDRNVFFHEAACLDNLLLNIFLYSLHSQPFPKANVRFIQFML